MFLLKPKRILNEDEEKRLIHSIEEAEKLTSGEIRVHVENKKVSDPYIHAVSKFEELGMTKTEARNGVLIYLNTKLRKAVILGDKGIHEKVGDNFWQEEVKQLTRFFAEGKPCEGLIHCVESAGKRLSEFFPRQTDDVNELSNNISGLDS